MPVKSGEVSAKAAEYAQTHCVGVTDLTNVDPTYGDLINVYIGSDNYLEKVGCCVHECTNAGLDSL